MKKLIGASVLVINLFGCNSSLFNQHAQMMDVMRGAIAESARRLGDSSVGQYAAGAQVQNPGIALEAGLVYRATAKYEGVAGQITASAQGTMDRPQTELERAEFMKIYRNSSLSDEQQNILLLELLRSRVKPEEVPTSQENEVTVEVPVNP